MINVFTVEIKDTTLKDRVGIVKTGLNVIEHLNNLRVFLNDNKEKALNDFDSASDILVYTEDMLNVPWDNLKIAFSRMLGSTPSQRRRLNFFNGSYQALLNIIDKNTTMWLPYDKESYEKIQGLIKESLGQICCYLYYQFELGTVYNLEDNEDIFSLSDAFDYWKTEKGVSDKELKNLVNFIFDTTLECRPTMGVFEMHPEYLEPFQEIVGQAIYDCEDVSLREIKEVVNGNVPVEDFLEELEKRHEANGDI